MLARTAISARGVKESIALFSETLEPLQAKRLQGDKGAVLVDVRVPWDFEKQHIEGAVSVPLYRGVAGKTPWDTVKRAVMAVGFAMKATGAPQTQVSRGWTTL